MDPPCTPLGYAGAEHELETGAPDVTGPRHHSTQCASYMHRSGTASPLGDIEVVGAVGGSASSSRPAPSGKAGRPRGPRGPVTSDLESGPGAAGSSIGPKVTQVRQQCLQRT